MFTHTRVHEVVVTEGRVRGVRTEWGDIEAEVVVNAGGMYAAEIGRMAGIRVPVIPFAHEYLVTQPFRDRKPGDHLPTLGAKFAGFTESGVLADSFGGFTADMYMFSAATPLIVIDGRNGPLNVGSLPMYRVPRLVMDLIGEDGPTIFDLAAPPAHTAPRPLPGVLLDHRDAAAYSLCTDQDSGANCQQMSAWLSDVQLISHDIFSGHEHAVKLLDGRAIAGGSTIGTPDADGQSPDLPSTPANADLPTDGGNGNALGFKPDAVQPAGNR